MKFQVNVCFLYDKMYTVEPRLMVTSLLQPLFLAARLNDATFPFKKTLVKTAIPLIPRNFFEPLVTVLTGFHCISTKVVLYLASL